MTHNNYYDVTQWHIGNPYKDIGEVINSIILILKNDKPQLMLITAGNLAPLSIFRPAIIISRRRFLSISVI